MIERRLTLLTAVACALLLAALPHRAHAVMPPLQPEVAPAALAAASRAGLFAEPPRAEGARTQVVTAWRIPVLLVSFADDTVRYGAADFDRLLFDTTGAVPTGSLAEYWKTASGGRMRITGRVVGSVVLPQASAYYAGANYGVTATGTPNNEFGFAVDALRLGQGAVNWNEFDLNYDGYVDMVYLVHAGVGGEGGDRNHLWSLTSAMTAGWSGGSAYPTTTLVPGSLTRAVLIDRFTVLPERSLFHPGALTEIGVYCHEFGHALGLPDLYNVENPRNTGPGHWSLMSTGAYGGDGHSPELPVLPGAWPLQYLGWDKTVRPARDTTLTLRPMTESPDVLELWYQGADAPEHFLLENRRRTGYDRNLPGEGLLVYHVSEMAIGFGISSNRINTDEAPGLQVVEADGDLDLWLGRNRGDANDPLPGALGITRMDDATSPPLRAFGGSPVNIALEEVTPIGTSTRVRVRVRPLGWQPVEDRTGAGFSPIASRTPARCTARSRDGTGYVVASERTASGIQVVLRTSAAWDAPVVLSHTTGNALDPSLARFADDDLAVVWSDSRNGKGEIWMRSRVRGAWGEERRLVSLGGNCRTPSLASDARGGLSLAFQEQAGDTLRVHYARFHYAAKIVQPVAVFGPPLRPANPVVLTAPDGHGWLLWNDRRTGGKLWCTRVSPDSIVRSAQVLSDGSWYNTSYTAALDSSGALYVVWSINSVQGSGLVLHKRGGIEGPLPQEEDLEPLTLPLESMTLDVDSQHGLHLAYSVATVRGAALRYKRCAPRDRWDAGTTDLSFPGGDAGTLPLLLPRRDGNIDVAYVGIVGQQTRFAVRRRMLVADAPVADAPPHAAPAVTARLAPNPLRPGLALDMRFPAATASAVDVYDAAGRRVASVPATRDALGIRAHVPAAATRGWAGGVYFVRARGSAGATRVVVMP